MQKTTRNTITRHTRMSRSRRKKMRSLPPLHLLCRSRRRHQWPAVRVEATMESLETRLDAITATVEKLAGER